MATTDRSPKRSRIDDSQALAGSGNNKSNISGSPGKQSLDKASSLSASSSANSGLGPYGSSGQREVVQQQECKLGDNSSSSADASLDPLLDDMVMLDRWGLTRCDLHKPIRKLLTPAAGNDSIVTKPPTDTLALKHLLPGQGQLPARSAVEANVSRQFLEDAFKSDIGCPVCLEPLKNTWTVMACLHRFCSDCFHRSLRMELGSTLSNKECPLCRFVVVA
jgi:hypothetical protein